MSGRLAGLATTLTHAVYYVFYILKFEKEVRDFVLLRVTVVD
jgi:hypothetical protein